ncbi:MAG: DNA repair exonuclease [Planctomycetaceae bacterium]|nr:DNA repair exonuclease [Planctomycetales bacterium]MCB9941059.1 DNA repair exonuclease [Planctomycetaceae bacterium]
MFKFIHTADLHIDSPLRGLEAYEGAPVEQFREATRVAFENLVTLAIDRQVAFVVIAGDLFDGKWQDMKTGLWTAGQFRRLERETIPVYLLRGNHDAASKVRQAVSWPENVREFSVRKPETFLLEEFGVALHGQGFSHQECNDDLAATYPQSVDGMFNIGVLHTSLTGSAEHDTYAPTSEAVLRSKGYDYWALGHIHQRSEPPISSRPYIGYSGNTQGRHIRETGPRGCLLHTVVDGELDATEFIETDTLRWHLAEVNLNEQDNIVDLVKKVRQQVAACHEAGEGRFSAVRVVVRGACAAHRELVHALRREETLAEIRNLANEFDDEVWIEKIKFETKAPIDIEQLRKGSDLVSELLRTIDALRDDDTKLSELAEELSPLAAKATVELSECGIDLQDSTQLRDWLQQAEGLLVSQLLEADA